jgi:hypothetical protein
LIKAGLPARPPLNTYLDGGIQAGTTWFYRVQLDN